MDADDIGRILDELRERLGPTGQYAWTTLVTGERVMGIVGFSVGLVLVAATVVLVLLARWAYRKHQDAGAYDSHDLLSGAFGAVAILTTIGVVGFIATAVPSIFFPEYVVLRQIIGGLR